jgi:hypothetical protein
MFSCSLLEYDFVKFDGYQGRKEKNNYRSLMLITHLLSGFHSRILLTVYSHAFPVL